MQQDRIVVEKFPAYWNAANVHIDRIVYRPITDSTVRLANLKSGALDLIERALATDIKEIKADAKLKLATQIEIGYQGLTLNVANGPAGKDGPFAKSPKVRQALEAAIDREAVNQVVYNGEALPGNQWISPRNPYYQAQFPVQKRDVAKAKKLLEEAGLKAPVAVDLMVPNTPDARQTAEVLQAMAAEAGFDMKIRVTEFATSLKEAEEGRFQAWVIGWSGRVDPDGNSYIFHKSKAPQNNGLYSNAEIDQVARRPAQGVHDRRAQGDLRQDHGEISRRGQHHLPLPPPGDHRPLRPPRGLRADARRPRPRRRPQTETLRKAPLVSANAPRRFHA